MSRLSTDLHRLERELRGRFEVGVAIVGNSPAMQEIYKTVGRVAKTDATVLIQGESGTGKELIAKVIHYHSTRWSGPFIAHQLLGDPARAAGERAVRPRARRASPAPPSSAPGKFELAQGGTRAASTRSPTCRSSCRPSCCACCRSARSRALGGREVVKVDCRILAATNQSLDRAVKRQRFREDLFFRLNVVPISVPPLRERRGDIAELITFFLAKINREMGTVDHRRSRPEARDMLIRHNWPGNVRELENTLVRAAVLAAGPDADAARSRRSPRRSRPRRCTATCRSRRSCG